MNELFGGLSAAALRCLSRLTNCSHLVLEASYGNAVSLSVLQKLQGLTLLHLSKYEDFDLFCSKLPDFSRFTALKHLHIDHSLGSAANGLQLPTGPKFRPTQLAGLTGLQHLHLVSVAFSRGAAGGAELLAVLPQLSSLTHLGLVYTQGLRQCPAESLSTITSSSSLQHLDLERLSLQLPGEHESGYRPWQHIFPPNRQLLQLTSVSLCSVLPRLTHVDVQACVSCCPNLQELDIAGAPADGMLPNALLQLSGLTSLTTLVSDADMGVLAQLTGLQELTCGKLLCKYPDGTSIHHSITQTGLLQLTALKQLTRLRVLDGFQTVFSRRTPFVQLLARALQAQQLDDGYRVLQNKVRLPGVHGGSSACRP